MAYLFQPVRCICGKRSVAWGGLAFCALGALNGLATIVEKGFKDLKSRYFKEVGLPSSWWISKLLFVLFTFTYWNFTLVIFRANSISDALMLVQNLGIGNYNELFSAGLFELGLGREEFYAALISIVLLTIFEWCHQNEIC